jgi:hypothetical protein
LGLPLKPVVTGTSSLGFTEEERDSHRESEKEFVERREREERRFVRTPCSLFTSA